MLNFTKWLALAVVSLAPVFAHAELKLKDFEGNFISSAPTTGSFITGDPFFASFSGSTIAQLDIDDQGRGTINFFSSTQFFGLADSTSNAAIQSTNTGTQGPLGFTVSITDKKRGCGRIVIHNYPLLGTNLVTDFVAFQDKHGKVVKFVQNPVSVPALNAFIITNERQN